MILLNRILDYDALGKVNKTTRMLANPDHIYECTADDDGTLVSIGVDSIYRVKESLTEISELIELHHKRMSRLRSL